MRADSRWRDLLSCVALANLIMMKVWLQLLPFDRAKDLWLAHSPGRAYAAAMIDTVVLGAVLWLLAGLAARRRWSADLMWPLLYALAFYFTLNGIRSVYDWSLRSVVAALGLAGAAAIGVVLLAALGALSWLIVSHRVAIARQHHVVTMVCVPFLVLTFGQSLAAMRLAEPESAFLPHARHGDRVATNPAATPVVWIVFDELDYGLAFERRPKDLELPQFDSLRAISLTASHAFSPFGATQVSLPALLTGRILRTTRAVDAHDMTLVGADGSRQRFASEPTVLDDMRARGYRTALFGWYFPYARMLGSADVVEDYPTMGWADSDRLAIVAADQLRSLVETLYYSPFGTSMAIRHHIAITTGMQHDVLAHLAAARGGEFAFLHYPVPHSLNIYHPRTRSYGANTSVQRGYLDNLALVDRLLGEVRVTMEHAGTWDRALVVVTSDHHLRVNPVDHVVERLRVPFLVKLPHQTRPLVLDTPCETAVTRGLVEQVADGRLATPEAAAGWIVRASRALGPER